MGDAEAWRSQDSEHRELPRQRTVGEPILSGRIRTRSDLGAPKLGGLPILDGRARSIPSSEFIERVYI